MSSDPQSSIDRPIRDLHLKIAGTRLEPIVRIFEEELRQAGLVALQPRYHLSTEWGVPFGSITIGIPFYLVSGELTKLQEQRVGHVEGFDRGDILRYLRHEMGHVVNYAYQLYEREDWIKLFGSLTQPYEEDYRPQAFSRDYVWHLPGWYAQKHPDEDWAETFAVWMTPGGHWREDYREYDGALAKLNYCDRLLASLRTTPPLVAVHEVDEDVGELTYSIDSYYQRQATVATEHLPGLDGSLRTIFLDWEEWDAKETAPSERARAGDLIRRVENDLLDEVFRWTGHFPERTKDLTQQLAQRADVLDQWYVVSREAAMIVALTTYVSSLASNFVHHGSYFPELHSGTRSDPAKDTTSPSAAISGDGRPAPEPTPRSG